MLVFLGIIAPEYQYIPNYDIFGVEVNSMDNKKFEVGLKFPRFSGHLQLTGDGQCQNIHNQEKHGSIQQTSKSKR
jgi:hypothetical protein